MTGYAVRFDERYVCCLSLIINGTERSSSMVNPHCIRFTLFTAVIWLSVATTVVAQTRASVPSATRQAELRKVLDETFEIPKATTNSKRQDVVKKLMAVVESSADASDDLYVMLTAVLALTKETGEFTTYQKAAGRAV